MQNYSSIKLRNKYPSMQNYSSMQRRAGIGKPEIRAAISVRDLSCWHIFVIPGKIDFILVEGNGAPLRHNC
jgi:hypothetical protein